MRARGEGRGGSCSFYFHSVYAVLAFLYAAGAGAAGKIRSTKNNRKKIGEGKNNEGEGDRGRVSYCRVCRGSWCWIWGGGCGLFVKGGSEGV